MDFRRKKIRLGDALVSDGVITEEQLQKYLEKQRTSNKKLGELLIDEGVVSEEIIAKTLSNQLGYAMIENLEECNISDDILSLVPVNVIQKYSVMPVEYSPESPNILRLAMIDPQNLNAIDDVALITNLEIEPVISTTKSINMTIDKYFGRQEMDSKLDEYTKGKEEEEEEDEYADDINNSPIVQLVTTMIDSAVRQRASDIHIEPLEKSVRIRYRIDGTLYERATYSHKILNAIVARIKIIGGMDIAEKRKPQDGRITQVVDRMEYDIRVSILPTVFGEKAVLRLLGNKRKVDGEKTFGMREADYLKVKKMLEAPHGIIYLTGPTGSGKTTTLYMMLESLLDGTIWNGIISVVSIQVLLFTG